MIPKSSNTDHKGCSPVSSSCVIWQGPSLKCINLCTGDTIDDITYRLAEEICSLQEQLDLSDLDLSCLVQACSTCPEPSKLLASVLDLLIQKVCTLEELIGEPGIDGTYTEPTLTLPACLQTEFISELVLSSYVVALANKICAINTDAVNQQNQILSLDSRVTDLETAEEAGGLQVTPNCLLPAIPTDIELVVDEIESVLCGVIQSLGDAGDITTAASQQCASLASADALSQDGTMSSAYPTWSPTVSTLADSINNLWITVCDIRGAVKAIQDNCCSFTCADIIIDFDMTIVDGGVLLFFGSKSVLPVGFTDCDAVLGNKITFTDGDGHQFSTYIKLKENVFDDPDALTNGYPVIEDLGTTPLVSTTGLTAHMDACLTNGSLNCVKCVTVEIDPTQSCDFCQITAVAGEGEESSITIIYELP